MITNNELEFAKLIGNTFYLFYITIQSDKLSITLESMNETKYWCGSWSNNQIEDITIKATNHKSYEVFTKMITTIFTTQTNILSLNLLNFSDFEALKKKHAKSFYFSENNNSYLSTNETLDPNNFNTLFLIVQYKTDFEQSQFPLKLTFIEKPNNILTSRTIARLRVESKKYDDVNENSRKEIQDMRIEIINLKKKNKTNRKFTKCTSS